MPLQPIVAREVPTTHVPAEPDRLSNLVGAGYQAYEDAVLKKLQKVCAYIYDHNYCIDSLLHSSEDWNQQCEMENMGRQKDLPFDCLL